MTTDSAQHVAPVGDDLALTIVRTSLLTLRSPIYATMAHLEHMKIE